MQNAMIRRLVVRAAAGTAACLAAPALAVQNPACPADLDCNGEVDVFDLLHLLSEWGEPDSNADLTGSGTVDVFDLLELLGQWGPCVFEYPDVPSNTEAWQISLEMLGPDGPLLPPQEIFDRIATDLDLIRAEIDLLEDVIHSPAWVANTIIVSYPADLNSPEIECLLTAYQGDVVNVFFGHMHVIHFAGQSNMEAMAAKFDALPETAWAQPDNILGGDNSWVPTDLGDGVWHWWVNHGFHDCFDGCDCQYFFDIETDADGNVKLIELSQWGMPWCEWPF